MEEAVLKYETEDWNVLQYYVAAALSGSQWAWEYLKKTYTRVVMKQVRKYYFIGGESYDVEATAWGEFCMAVGTYKHEPGRKLSVWIYFRVRKALIGEIRKRMRKKRLVLSDSVRIDNTMDLEEWSTENEIIEGLNRKESVKRYVKTLSDLERNSVRMLADGYNYKEIAKFMHCSTKSVDNAISRAKRKWEEFQKYE